MQSLLGSTLRPKQELSAQFALLWPMVISYASRFVMATTDAAFVGHLESAEYTSADYLAAATLSDVIVSILCAAPLAFNDVLDSLCSQAIGSDNPKVAGVWLQLSLICTTLVHIPFLLGFLLVEPMLISLSFSTNIAHLAGIFSMWCALYPIPNSWYQCLRFYLQAQDITYPAMYNNLVFVGVNAVLNWLFVFGGPFGLLDQDSLCFWPGLGFIGSPISLSISRTLQPCAFWMYAFWFKKHHLKTWNGWDVSACKSKLRAYLAQALPSVGSSIAQTAISQVQTVMIGKMGTDIPISTLSALINTTQIWTGGIGSGLIAVAAIRVGRFVGSSEIENAKQAASMVMYLSLGTSLFAASILMVLRTPFLSITTLDPDILILGGEVMLPYVISCIFTSFISVVTAGIFSGQGRTKIETYLSLGFELPFTIGTCALFVFYFQFGLLHLNWAMCAIFLVEALLVVRIYKTSDWHRYTVETSERQAK